MYDLDEFQRAVGRFSDRIEIISALKLGDKITDKDTYKMIKKEFKKVKKIRKINLV